ncbi:MAG: hypothetical protein ACYTHJ_07465 [Planctomycetota bacterium]|jgi:hypothetical protein
MPEPENKGKRKLDKKALKARAKVKKNQLKSQEVKTSTSHTEDEGGISPAERSANAAEKQVRLQLWRVALALFAVVIAGAMLLFTIRPWQ